jgi:peptidoglycan/xylan/chitin deacetylase (PgdA/CDA1 family)
MRNNTRPIILLYHSIDDRCGRPDFWQLSVSPENFLAQMQALVSERTVISIEELGRQLHDKCLQTGTAVVTFDDGYANNWTVARPILEQIGISATTFIATGMIGDGEFWWDRLERILTDATLWPEIVQIRIGPQLTEIGPTTDRTYLLKAIWARLRDVASPEREAALDRLEESLAAAKPERVNRPVTAEEVRKMSEGAISVGAHTVSHPWLPLLPPSRLAHEIADSKTTCEDLVRGPITAFAYPFGVYNEASRAAVMEHRFSLAFATIPTAVGDDPDPFGLPRVAVANWSAEDFVRRLESL